MMKQSLLGYLIILWKRLCPTTNKHTNIAPPLFAHNNQHTFFCDLLLSPCSVLAQFFGNSITFLCTHLTRCLVLTMLLMMGVNSVSGASVTLSQSDIYGAGDGQSGYATWTIGDWEAYAIKNKHSNATSSQHYLQIKAYASSTAYYIKVPTVAGNITSIKLTVSNANKSMADGGNTATLYFSSSNQTKAAGEGVASGTGASSITIDCSTLGLQEGYITASGGVRIWEVEVIYELASAAPQPPTITAPVGGTKHESVTISIDKGANSTGIYYTLEGVAEPDVDYTGPFPLAITLPQDGAADQAYTYIIQAYSYNDELNPSTYTTPIEYYFQTETPTISVASGTYTSVQTVTIECPTSTSIWYTTDGTDPAGNKSNGITSGETITIDASCKLRVVAERTNFDVSEEASADYIINIPTPFTVTWMNNGVQYGEVVTVLQGEKVTSVPTELSAPAGYSEKTFVGWTALTTYADEEYPTAPADLFIDAANSPTIEGNTVFYAVFADESSEKMSGVPVAEGTYYIAHIRESVTYYLKANGNSNPIATTDKTQATKFDVRKSEENYIFYLHGDHTQWLTGTKGSTDVRINTGTNDVWKIEIGETSRTGSYNIVNTETTNNSGSLTPRYLTLKSDLADFRAYTDATSSRTENSELIPCPTNYTTYCESDPDKLHTITVTPIGVEGCGATAEKTTLAEGRSTKITATVADGYTFAGWTVTGATPADATALSTTITMGTEDVTVTANFVEGTYHLVTNSSALTAGDELLLASYLETNMVHKNVIASDIQANKRLHVVFGAFLADKSTVTCLPAAHTVFTLDGEIDAYTLHSNLGYLTVPDANTNDLAWNENASSWEITIGADNHAILRSNSRYLACNLSQNYFIADDELPNAETSHRYVLLYRKLAVCGLEVIAPTKSYLVGGEVDKNELTIHALYNNGDKKKIASENVTLEYDFREAGENKEVEVSYTENGRTVTYTYPVTVTGYSEILFKMNNEVVYTANGLAGTTLTAEQIAEAEEAAQSEVCDIPYAYTFVGWSDHQGEIIPVKVDEMVDFIGSGRTFYAIYVYNKSGDPTTLIDEHFTEDKEDWKTTSGNYSERITAGEARLASEGKAGDIFQQLSITQGTFVSVTFKARRFKETDSQNLTVKLGDTILATEIEPGVDYATYVCAGYAPTDNPELSFSVPAKHRVYLDDIVVKGGMATTKPKCGAYLEITSAESIYLTSSVGTGTDATRSTVETKIYFEGHRLKADGTAPSVYVAAEDISSPTITVDVSKENQTIEESGDGTYGVSGYAIVKYTPTATDEKETATITFKVHHNTAAEGAKPVLTVHTRSLPSQFVIATQIEDQWYALPANMPHEGTHAPIAITVESSEVISALPSTVIYAFDGVPYTGNREYVRFIGSGGAYLWGSTAHDTPTHIRNFATHTPEGTQAEYNWLLNTTDNVTYTITNAVQVGNGSERYLTIDTDHWGMYKKTPQEIRFLPLRNGACDVTVPNGNSWIVPADVTMNHLVVEADAKVEIAEDATLNVATLTLHSEGDSVPQLEMNGSLHVAAQAFKFIKRIDDQRYYFFSTPYDYNVADVEIDGVGDKYANQWIAAHYDGVGRTENYGHKSNWVNLMDLQTLEAGKGYAIALANGIGTKDLVFTFNMSGTDLSVDNNKDATYQVTAHGKDKEGLHHSNIGWNFVAHPFLNEHNAANGDGFSMPTPSTWMKYVAIPQVGSNQTYLQCEFADLGKKDNPSMLPFTGFFVQVAEHGSVVFTKGAADATFFAPRREQYTADEAQPIVVGLNLTNGEYTDATSLIIGNQFTDDYEIGSDFEKMLGLEQYPQLYIHDASYRYAFKSISEDAATQMIPLGAYFPAKEEAEYTISLKEDTNLSQVQAVYLYDSETDLTVNLMQTPYTFTNAYEHTTTRFALSPVLAPRVTTDLDRVQTTWTVWQDAPLHVRLEGLVAGDRIRVINATGQLVFTAIVTSSSGEISLPTTGAYCVEIIGQMGLQVKKMIVK